jgi:prepilin-type N-terminal cleavage/methylation domain-containing protein
MKAESRRGVSWRLRHCTRVESFRFSLSAFTLLEVLIAVALIGLLMVGLNLFVFSMGELWGKNTDKRLFDRHVRSVTRFLEHELRAAALPPASTVGQPAIGPQDVTPTGASPDHLLTFDLIDGSHLLTWPTEPLPEVVCSLQVRPSQGLFLLWHSRLEMNFASDSPRETAISPFVTALAYDYYDADMKRWVSETALRRDPASGNYLAPQRLRLKFVYGTLTQDTVITLPIAQEGLPNF